MAEVRVAKSAGFCYGVERAVKLAEETAREKGGCAMLGSIIHNVHVVAELEALGARQVDSVEEVRPGETVIIRSHGEGKAVYDQLAAMGCPVADATCVKVAHIHKIVKEASDRGRQVIIIGAPEHPEVKAIAGWCIGAKIFRNVAELTEFLEIWNENSQKPVTLVSQTTSTDRIWIPCREK